MSISLDGPLVLYSLQTLKDEAELSPKASSDQPSSPESNESLLESLQDLCSEAVSFPAFIATANKLSTQPNYVTSIEWRSAPHQRMHHEYVVLYVSSSPQASPCIAIRLDRFGKLGIRERWWQRNPWHLTPNNIRASTTVLAGPIGHDIVDPSKGDHFRKYQHWTHALPSSAPFLDLKQSLENARRDTCTVINEALRRYESNGLYLRNAKHGRRWADSRGLDYLHADIANVLAEAMDTGILRCMIQSFWVRLVPPQLVLFKVLKNVQVRREYARIVEDYRTRLRRIIDSCSELDSEARARVRTSWGVEELLTPSPPLVQLLNRSLSAHAFVSPYAPIATLSDVASRFDTICSLMPESGISTLMCRLYTRTLMARFPDELWHGYTISMTPMPSGRLRAAWRRARNSEMFWAFFDVIFQWLIFLALLPVDGISGIWVLIVPIIHVWINLPWYMKERTFWRRLWKVYDGSPVQAEGEAWHRNEESISPRSTKLPHSSKTSQALLETAEIGLEVLREH
ncbi:Pre-mRNA-splicing factor SPP382 [Rhizoctonia solani]|uniref:Pre-mRNA-splicing factor SPP382 n=1 Tax=Rhizoctonia solani TaxID=456999 RepID=A0A0K6GDQ1_9AGAM|nr:Pre-mRNA-splicing factor SPP382 [Rhizoctonia solani]